MSWTTSGPAPRAATGAASSRPPSANRSRTSSGRRWPIWRSSRTNRTASALVVLLAVAASVAAAEPAILVATGDVTPTSAVVWARGRHAGTLEVLYGVVGADAPPARRALSVTAGGGLPRQGAVAGPAPAAPHPARPRQ